MIQLDFHDSQSIGQILSNNPEQQLDCDRGCSDTEEHRLLQDKLVLSLFRFVKNIIWGMLAERFRNECDVEQLALDTLSELIPIASNQPALEPCEWIPLSRTIAQRNVCDAIKRLARRKRLGSARMTCYDVQMHSSPCENPFQQAEANDLEWRILSLISHKHSIVLKLRIAGLSCSEIAIQIGYSERTVERWMKAIQKTATGIMQSNGAK